MSDERTDEDDRRHEEVVAYIVRQLQGDPELEESLASRIMEHINIDGLVRVIADRVLELFTEEGFCSYGWHVSETEFEDGRCEECGEPREHANHRSVLVCSWGQDPPMDVTPAPPSEPPPSN